MAQALSFSLVSPERALFSGEAEAVLVPGAEGQFEVGVGHAPVMATLSPGILVIRQGGEAQKYYVRGGFADVTANGLTVLAEIAIPENELRGDTLGAEKTHAQKVLDSDPSPEMALGASRALEALAAY